jgi:hypothetical protein
MTQNSILNCNLTSGILFPARSLPLVCAVDTLDVLLQFLRYLYDGLSAPDAAKCMVQNRMWWPPQSRDVDIAADDDISDDGDAGPPPLSLSNQHLLAHTVVFALSVLPQAIKLFAMHGIRWMQICGGLYLSSFLVLAGMGMLARHADGVGSSEVENTWHQRMRRIFKMGHVATVMAHVGLWVWCLWMLLHPVWGSFKHSTFHDILVLLTSTVAYFGLLSLIPGLVFLPERATASSDSILVVVVSIVFAISFSVLGFLGVTYFFLFYMWKIMDFALIPLYLLITVGLMIGMVSHLLHRFPMGFRTFQIILFGVVNLVFCFLYYCFRYDPKGTIKPSWDILG